jgi:hypothetical protein
MKKSTDKLIELLKSQGYVVKKKTEYVKKTMDIDPELLKRLSAQLHKENLTLREAINGAIKQWLENRK